MAAEDGSPAALLIQSLEEEGFRYEFFHAVWLLEKIHEAARLRLLKERAGVGVPEGAAARGREIPQGVESKRGDAFEGVIFHDGVGGDLPPDAEAVRFRARLSLSVPASRIDLIRRLTPEESLARGEPPRFELVATFFGLYGLYGVLPWFYTEILLRQEKSERWALRDFLDMFNHRLLSLYYRAWCRARYSFGFRDGARDNLSRRLLCYAGLSDAVVDELVLGLPPARLLRYIGLFTLKSRPAAALELLLSDWFDGVPVRVEQLVGEWASIPQRDRCRLGRQNHRLGLRALGTKEAVGEAVIGRRAWTVQNKFRVVLGPLEMARYTRFLPGGEDFKTVVRLTRIYGGATCGFDVVPILDRFEMPRNRARLGRGQRLGWTTFMASLPPQRNLDNVAFSCDGKVVA